MPYVNTVRERCPLDTVLIPSYGLMTTKEGLSGDVMIAIVIVLYVKSTNLKHYSIKEKMILSLL